MKTYDAFGQTSTLGLPVAVLELYDSSGTLVGTSKMVPTEKLKPGDIFRK